MAARRSDIVIKCGWWRSWAELAKGGGASGGIVGGRSWKFFRVAMETESFLSLDRLLQISIYNAMVKLLLIPKPYIDKSAQYIQEGGFESRASKPIEKRAKFDKVLAVKITSRKQSNEGLIQPLRKI